VVDEKLSFPRTIEKIHLEKGGVGLANATLYFEREIIYQLDTSAQVIDRPRHQMDGSTAFGLDTPSDAAPGRAGTTESVLLIKLTQT
jgi:hypothetical protein